MRLAGISLCASFIISAAASGQTVLTGNMTVPRSWPAVTLLNDGRVLVTGGGHGLGYLASAELFDPQIS